MPPLLRESDSDYGAQIGRSRRLACQALLLQQLVETMPRSQVRELATWWRQMAPGDPIERGYIANLIEGKEKVRAR